VASIVANFGPCGAKGLVTVKGPGYPTTSDRCRLPAYPRQQRNLQ
jgi:hypothetical protein